MNGIIKDINGGINGGILIYLLSASISIWSIYGFVYWLTHPSETHMEVFLHMIGF